MIVRLDWPRAGQDPLTTKAITGALRSRLEELGGGQDEAAAGGGAGEGAQAGPATKFVLKVRVCLMGRSWQEAWRVGD